MVPCIAQSITFCFFFHKHLSKMLVVYLLIIQCQLFRLQLTSSWPLMLINPVSFKLSHSQLLINTHFSHKALFDCSCLYSEVLYIFSVLVPDYRFGNSKTIQFLELASILGDWQSHLNLRAVNQTAVNFFSPARISFKIKRGVYLACAKSFSFQHSQHREMRRERNGREKRELTAQLVMALQMTSLLPVQEIFPKTAHSFADTLYLCVFIAVKGIKFKHKEIQEVTHTKLSKLSAIVDITISQVLNLIPTC